ncbi:MAG: hypothetical protein LBL17_02305 [Coxiellaceae bacterium]|jgi:ABC-type uncharacterized transport system substrate-binding protein|nr:hypothetical protein [Coxiellaceae bacterium]
MRTLINKLFLVFQSIALMLCFSSSCCAQKPQLHVKKIGVVIPIEHAAIREIARAFRKTLPQLVKQPIKFSIRNAQGDSNLQRAIISQMRDANYDLIVPISTTVTQMSMALTSFQPIIGLAADVGTKQSNVVIVNDEIDKAISISFIHKIYPEVRKLIIVHSTSNKIFNEVKQVEKACKFHKIVVQRLMIQSLADLYSASQAMPTDIQAIFILKDNLVASGINTLVQVTKQRKIPLITSDEGTVKNGACFSLGVHEKSIGVEGAKLAAKILQGTTPNSLVNMKLTKPTVFVNLKSLAETGQSIKKIEQITRQLGYPLEKVSLDNL